MKNGQSFSHDPLPETERIAYLIAGFIRHTLTEEEHDELDNWIVESEANMRLFEELTDERNMAQSIEWYYKLQREKNLQYIKNHLNRRQQPLWRRMAPYAVAASVVLLASIAFFMYRNKPEQKVTAAQMEALDIPPATNKATLTLANGQTIELDNAPNGILAAEGAAQINKEQGILKYNTQPDNTTVAIGYNTITIPRGGYYQLVLADGSKVWLNAASSLTYPTTFTGRERRVQLTGEGYFEVAHNKDKPFRVQTGGMEVEVLGTHFNIMGYAEEPAIQTTLLEGSVKVKSGGKEEAAKAKAAIILRPGQQAQTTTGGTVVVKNANVQKAVAWKEGQFDFSEDPIRAVMRQVSRWYNVEVEYKDDIQKHFNATIPRTLPLSKVLHLLELTKDVHFETKGNKVIVHH